MKQKYNSKPEIKDDKFRILFEQSAVAIAILRESRMIFVNKQFLKMFGYDNEKEVMGKSFFDFVAPSSKDALKKREESLRYDINGNVPSELEAAVLRKDGTEFYIWAATSHVDLSDGQASLGYVIDITERKRTEEQLKNIKAAIDATSDAIGMSTPHGIHFYQNSAFDRMFGYTIEEVSRLHFAVLYKNKNTAKIVFETISSGNSWSGEVEMVAKNGRCFSVSLRADAVKDENSKIICLIGVHTDITEQKRTEEAMQKNEALLKSLFNATPVGIELLINRVHIKVNNALCRITGYQEDELLGKSTRMLYPDENEFNRVGNELYGQMEREGLGTTEARLKRKDGAMIDVLFFMSPFDPKNISAGVTVTVLDITEKKKMEAEKADLEDMLIQSQKIESVGRLAGGIAHDFNNLLTAIMGNTELAMLSLNPEDKVYSRLNIIKKAADGAANLTKQLLAFSRKQIIEPKIINLNELIIHTYKMIVTSIREDIFLRIIPGDDLYSIMADAGQIDQILINIVTNARDAMPAGGILTIETYNVFIDTEYCLTHANISPGNYVVLAVSDTGTGMKKEIIDHIFEPFFTTKEKGRGTGLGLATVYGIVKQNRGYIEVYSEPGEGTTFKLYFPGISQQADEIKDTGRKTEIPGGTETILLVEDREEVLKFCGETLRHLGYNVIEAQTGEDALNYVDNHDEQIHLLMTDIVLPGINGRETADYLLTVRPGIKILFNSGYTAEVIDRHGILEQGLNFIGKPFTSRSLAVKVREVLDKK